jgi:3-deoxy-7-phosphoheptulonate synthase
MDEHKATTGPHPLAARAANPAGSRVQVGGVAIGGREFVVIAGPCSVESAAQVRHVVERVAHSGAALFRAGAWKPRSSPYAFQGLGDEGLDILAAHARPTLPVVSEVLDTSLMADAAARIDVIQIGARNMHNGALLRAAAATGRPVLLKRGLAATLEELLLAAEYVLVHGNPHVILCERGIRSFDQATRNTADLASVALLKRLTHLPVLVDPSHATGRADLVPPVAAAALAAGADGLLVEVHQDPARAWSDAGQALSCEAFDDLMCSLTAQAPLFGRTIRVPDQATPESLARCRRAIDAIDDAVLALLEDRVRVAMTTATLKRRMRLPLRAPDRERDVFARIERLETTLGPAARRRIFRAVMQATLAAEQAHDDVA